MDSPRHGRRWRTLIACSLFLLLYSVQGFWFTTNYVQQAVRSTPVYSKLWEEKESSYNLTALNDSGTLSTLVDKSDFHFLTNHERCQGVSSVFMLIFVHSDPSHSDRRLAIRQTWGNESNLPQDNLRIIFLLGEVNDQQLQEDISKEGQVYEDLIQGNFVDSYRNLTYKHVMGLKWVSHYCRCAKYVFKTDDDIFVDIFQMVDYLKTRFGPGAPRNLMMCFIYRKAYVKRSRRSKWYVSVKEYKDHYYPTYCAGWGIVMSTDVVYDLYMESFKIPYFWVDDVLVSGILAQKIGITHTELNNKIPVSQRAITRWLASHDDQQPYLFGLPDSDIDTIYTLWNKTVQYYSKIKR